MAVDNYGRVILNGKAAARTYTIDIRIQPAGIYNLRLLNANENRTEKFMSKQQNDFSYMVILAGIQPPISRQGVRFF